MSLSTWVRIKLLFLLENMRLHVLNDFHTPGRRSHNRAQWEYKYEGEYQLYPKVLLVVCTSIPPLNMAPLDAD